MNTNASDAADAPTEAWGKRQVFALQQQYTHATSFPSGVRLPYRSQSSFKRNGIWHVVAEIYWHDAILSKYASCAVRFS